jgi:hypothetical protein
VRINLLSILINLSRGKPSFTRFFQFNLLPMVLSRLKCNCKTKTDRNET